MTLALCKLMGMSYDEIRALPHEVFEVLIEDVMTQQEQTEARVSCPL